MYNILAVITLIFSCYFILRILRLAGTIECILAFFCLSTAHVVIWGYILSFMGHLSDVRYWSILGLATAFLNFSILILRKDNKRLFGSNLVATYVIISIKNMHKEISHFDKLILMPLVLTVLLLGGTNFLVIAFSAPHNTDSITYHLARVAYYLQYNSINYFDANYWAQVVHPKNSSLLLLYAYLVSGKNENLTQLVQFISYWVAICSVYAISRKVGNSKPQSIFAAAVGALLTNWLMQATTTQNDMIITAYIGATVFFIFAFRETHKYKYLGLTALGVGLSIGTKASSFLPLLSLAFISLYTFFQSKVNLHLKLRNFAILLGCTLLAICIFALPSGYIENYHKFGHPIGPYNVRSIHSFEGKTIGYIARNGTKNLIRYGFDFLSLDGMPPISHARQAQNLIRLLPEKMVHHLGIDLETSEATRAPFNLQNFPSSHEDRSYWGVFGFGLVWIMILLSIVGAIKSTDIRILSLATVLFILSQAYSGPYDPWRGRYFTICAVFAVPIIGVALQAKPLFIRAYLLFIVYIGCISAVSAVLLRENSTLISINYKLYKTSSIFTMSRMEQLTRNRNNYYEPLEAFDRLVPSNSTVAVFLHESAFEYPLFAEHLTRTIIPINSFYKGLQPIPINAEYLLYTPRFPCADIQEDAHLGSDWYLRKLTDTNRRCP